jgi:hypothetical protein
MNDRMDVDEYRRLQGLPPRGRRDGVITMTNPGDDKRVKEHFLRGEEIDRHGAPFAPAAKGKAHHMLGRLGVGIMNKTEARFEREMLIPAKERGEITWYAFEGIKLRLAERTYLTVDFFVRRPDLTFEAIDVKGARAIVEEDARVKMKVAAAMFPFSFRLAFPRPRALGGGWLIEEVKG